MSKITKKRKVTYYIGLGMIIVGFILFISVFFQVASYVNNPFTNNQFFLGVPNRGPSFSNSIIGMLLMIGGSIVMNIGARGAAGSGLILDPEQAREDLKPFNQAKGGMINDVISNIDVVENITKPKDIKETIKIRCQSCKALNDEDAKFCKQCGIEL